MVSAEAYGLFECYHSLEKFTCASIFAETGKRTPVLVRFATIDGKRGAPDTLRDVRSFAVKFHADEGSWDLIGNNIPVSPIQDATIPPAQILATRPELDFGMAQATNQHDTFWSRVSCMPEATHMLLWLMSDRTLPRSYRMMQGFGVNTFRFVTASGESSFIKFHWQPLAGTYSLDWDEAIKIAGADPDFHRRDLWESIASGIFPEFELGVQVFTAEQAEHFTFDVLDTTKLVPEELVPIIPVGRMRLNRNPETPLPDAEHGPAGVSPFVPGIDILSDPLLSRKRPPAGDPYTQAALFWNSQSRAEKAHIFRAFRFELTRVTEPAVRARIVAMLANVSTELAAPLAQSLGLVTPEPLPKDGQAPTLPPELMESPALSLLTHPGDGTIRGRRIAILMAAGVNGDSARVLHARLRAQGAVPRFVGARLGPVQSESGESIAIEATLETTPAVLYDAVVVPDGQDAAVALGNLGHAIEFIKTCSRPIVSSRNALLMQDSERARKIGNCHLS